MQKTGKNLSLLSELAAGESGVLELLNLPEATQTHLMHMGLVPEATVRAVRRAPAGDPTIYAVDGLEIALRRETAQQIYIRNKAKIKVRNKANQKGR
jgi:ferrous iron transport protein A